MTSRFQDICLFGSLAASLYLIVWGVPSQIPQLDPSTPSSDKTASAQPQTPTFVPFSDNAIQVKESGKEEAPEELQAYLDAREVFEKRFGHPYDAPWEDQ